MKNILFHPFYVGQVRGRGGERADNVSVSLTMESRELRQVSLCHLDGSSANVLLISQSPHLPDFRKIKGVFLRPECSVVMRE